MNLVRLAALGLLLASPLGAQSTSDNATKRDTLGLPNDLTEPFFVFDAVSGSTKSSGTSNKYKQNDHIRIVVRDINPFLFAYRVETKFARLAEASPADFFKLVFDFTIPAGPKTDLNVAARVDSTQKGTVVGNEAACGLNVPATVSGPANEAARNHLPEWNRLLELQAKINKDLGQVSTNAEAILAVYRDNVRVIFNAGLRASKIQTAALAAANSLNALQLVLFPAETRVSMDVRDYAGLLGRFRTAITSFPGTFPGCATFPRWSSLSETMVGDTLRYVATVATMGTEAKRAETKEGILRPVASDSQRYYLSTYLPPLTTPHSVQVIVSRKAVSLLAEAPRADSGGTNPPAPSYDTLGSFFLNVGGHGRMTIAAGATWSDLPTREYGTVSQLAPAADGLPAETTLRITRKEDSQTRIVPMLYLNTQLFDLFPNQFPMGVHLVFGAGPKVTGQVSVDFLFGGGLSFLGDRVFLNGGVFVGRTQRLSGGLRVGQTVPTGTTIPIENRTAARPGIAISFRAIPW
jgi:hypothetical protein